jgi:4-hydroxybenzoate polyprenyltransferase
MNNQIIQFLKLIRIHQWSKNLLLFVPLIVSPELDDLLLWKNLVLAFFAFSFCASLGYIINDFYDLENDQKHPIKKLRPIASGFFRKNYIIFFAVILWTLSICASLLVSISFFYVLTAYFISTQIYTMIIKKIHIIDCVFLAFLYMMRIIAGCIAVNLEISIWLLSFSLFFFFSFALLKRYSELRNHFSHNNENFGRGYTSEDLPVITNMGISSSLISILVLGLYFNNDVIYSNYYAPKILFFFLPILLIWSCSIWSRTLKGIEINDPISFALTDRISLVIFIISLLIFTFARYEIFLI